MQMAAQMAVGHCSLPMDLGGGYDGSTGVDQAAERQQLLLEELAEVDEFAVLEGLLKV